MNDLTRLDLEQLRDGIRAIDAKLVSLLGERAAYSLAVGEVKRARSEDKGAGKSEDKKDAEGAVFRPAREADILRHLETLCDGPLPKAHLHAIYREILSSSRNLQRPQRVAYVGTEGSPSYIAGKNLLGSLADFHPRQSLEAVFQAVCDEECEIGIVPREHSPLDARPDAGPNASLDLFMRYPGIYILADTSTRFAIIGRTPADEPGPESTSSIMFSLPDGPGEPGEPDGPDEPGEPDEPDEPGVLLAPLCATGLGLLKLESRPLPGESKKRMFFADMAGNILSAERANALEEARQKCLDFRLLGCYPTLG